MKTPDLSLCTADERAQQYRARSRGALLRAYTAARIASPDEYEARHNERARRCEGAAFMMMSHGKLLEEALTVAVLGSDFPLDVSDDVEPRAEYEAARVVAASILGEAIDALCVREATEEVAELRGERLGDATEHPALHQGHPGREALIAARAANGGN